MSCLEKDKDCLLHMLIEQFRCEYKNYIPNNTGIQCGGVIDDGLVRSLSAREANRTTINTEKEQTSHRPGTAPSQLPEPVSESVESLIDEIIALQDKYTDLCHFQTALIENNVSCNTTSNSKNILSTVSLVIEAICSEIQSKNKEFTELSKE